MAPADILLYTGVMALVTYLIRMLPLTLIRRRVDSPLIRSFLYYVPYAVLAAMIVPEMLYATLSVWSAAAALVVGVASALRGRSMIAVAILACLTVFAAESLLRASGYL
ncbi:MAG: AzlD domain-containing protein [Peptococcaceae bacterium]|nr:AzlD domain-containing protein [Peptococcaceae bacterium]